MKFRKMTHEDINAAAYILRSCHNTIWPATTQYHDVYKHYLRNEISAYVLEAEEKVVAIAFAETTDNCYLSDLVHLQFAVDPNYARRGYGTAIVEHMVATFSDFRKIWLHVVRSNLPAVILFLKCGFEFESVDRCGYLGEDQYIMSIIRRH